MADKAQKRRRGKERDVMKADKTKREIKETKQREGLDKQGETRRVRNRRRNKNRKKIRQGKNKM